MLAAHKSVAASAFPGPLYSCMLSVRLNRGPEDQDDLNPSLNQNARDATRGLLAEPLGPIRRFFTIDHTVGAFPLQPP